VLQAALSLANALVIAQIALSMVLLIGAGLFLKSLRNLRLADTGLNPDGLLVMTFDSGYKMPGIQSFFAEVVSAARRIPGVISASPAFISPLSGGFAITHFSVPGYLPRPGEPDAININWIGTDYFRTLGATLLSGRELQTTMGLRVMSQSSMRKPPASSGRGAIPSANALCSAGMPWILTRSLASQRM
jgi:hypothetical protein